MSIAVLERHEVITSPPSRTVPSIQDIFLEAKKEAGVVRFRAESLHSFVGFLGRVVERVRFSGNPRAIVLPELTVYRTLLGLFIPQKGQFPSTETYQLMARRLLLPGESVWWAYSAREEQLCVCDGTVIGLST